MAAPEYRAGAEFRALGRTLSGVILRYGDISPGHRERFAPGAFAPVPAVPMRLQHDPAMQILPPGAFVLNDGPRTLKIRAELPAGSAAISLTRRGAISGWSVGFNSRQERRESGIRVIERAELVEVSLVDKPSYPESKAEIRARSGRTMRSSVPYDKQLACECIAEMGPGSGGSCIPMAKFAKAAGDEMAAMLDRAFAAAEWDILAIAGNYRRPLGSVSKGTLRARSTDDGLEVEIDLPAGAVGDEIVAANEAAGVVIRPLIDYDRSEFTDGPDGRTVTRPHLRAFIVGSTDTKAGWPDVAIDYDGEVRAAPAPRKRLRRFVL